MEAAMEAKEFLSRVVPADGSYYIGTLSGSKRKRYNQHQVDDLEQLDNEVRTLINKNEDIYFSTGTYSSGDTREAKNVKSKKSLYLDLDCGEGKAFTDKKAALIQFKQFLKDSALPMPSIIVDSGNGYHTYWTLDTAISTSEWGTYANALQTACEEHNLPADSKVTIDAARILRVPGTINFKYPTNPKKCSVIYSNDTDFSIDTLRKTFSNWIRPHLHAVSNTAGVDNSDLGVVNYSGIVWRAEHIFNECPTMAYIRETGGAECVEPLWMSTLHLLAFCEDGGSWIHEVSNKHPGYSESSTANKFAMRVKAKEEGRGKPTLCSTFAGYAGTKCAGCPHNGEIKSPISLGKPPANHLPQGYQQTKTGMFRYNHVDEEYIYLFPYRIEDFEVVSDDEDEQLLMFTYHIGNSGAKRAEIPYSSLSDIRAAQKYAAKFYMIFQDEQFKEFKKLMVTWAQQMEAAKLITSSPSKFGWLKKGDRYGFVLAEQIVWDDGSGSPVLTGANAVISQYKPQGKLKRWKEAADLIIQSGDLNLQVALASAFASPLIPFTGTSGMMLSIVSAKSGTGKSSALKTAQAVWGCPRRGVNALNDTPLSLVRRLGKLNNLPAYWDELHLREDVKQFTKLIFQLGQGKERSRLRSDASFQDVGTWETLITVASNESIADYMAMAARGTDAGAMRVLELEISSNGVDGDLASAMQTFGRLKNNYGEAGLQYAFYITEHREALKQKVKHLIDQLTTLSGVASGDRFRLATVAALVVGAQAANACGLVKFDAGQMLKYLVARVRDDKVHEREIHTITNTNWRSLALVSAFINEVSDQTYVTEDIFKRGMGSGDVGTIISLPKRFPVVIHNAQVAQVVRLDCDSFEKWLVENHGMSRKYINYLRSLEGVRFMPTGSLTSGLAQHVPGEYRRVLEIPYAVLESGS
jgi:hypothetical protein